MTNPINPINILTVPSVSITTARTGASAKANELGMRTMQERAYARRGEQYLLIKSPPASGKSRALMFIALDKLHNQGIQQAIVVVPERSIGGSFADEALTQHGFYWDWTVAPQWNLCNAPGIDEPRVAKSKVEAVKKFLESGDKVLVCTHATFRFAVEELGICLKLDPTNANRMFIAISAAGAFRTEDGGVTWTPINKGLRSAQIPDQDAEVGHCVHRIAMHASNPQRLYMQKHWDVMRSDDGGDNWHEVSGNLPTDFGFPIDVHAHEPETIYVVPITSDAHHFPPDGKLRVYRSRTGGNEWEALTNGLPQKDCYVNVLRDAMAVDTLDSCGVYFGTTGGQVYASSDSGDSWAPIVHDLPAVLSVEVQTLS